MDPGDAIGISMLESGGTEIADYASNRQYVTEEGNGSFAPASGVEAISVKRKVDFIAYYPYTGGMDGFNYPVDVSSQTNQEALDLLTAEKAAADQSVNTVNLSFKHRLSGVVLEIKAGENVEERELAGLQATITGQTLRGWYDINANQFSPGEEADQSIAFKMEADRKSGAAVILPAARGSARTMKLTLKTGNAMKVTFTKKITDDWKFEPGVRYQFPITLKRPSPSASVDEIAAEGGFAGTAEIGDWEEVKVEPDELSPDGPAISSVTVSPSSVSVVKGASQQFTATVNGTGTPSQSVSWRVEGAVSGASISSSGLLTVGANETAGSLTVRATSTADSSKSGTAAITVRESTLAEKLAWLQANAVSGGNYTFEVAADEGLDPSMLSYGGRTISITLRGRGAERTISLNSNGYLFYVSGMVTLTLDSNITLRGRSGNTSPVVWVDNGGRLVMNTGSKITGNTGGNGSGGGVAVGRYFEKIGGTIYGYTGGNSNSNKVQINGTIQAGRGHAVASAETYGIKYKDSTAGTGVNLMFDRRTSPVTFSGAWDN